MILNKKKLGLATSLVVAATVVVLLNYENTPTAQAQTLTYRPGPAIADAAIYKSIDMKWFHISEVVELKVKATDLDERCGPETNHQWETFDNPVDYPSAKWWQGEDVIGTGQVVSWQPSSHTGESGIQVKVEVDDDPTSPSIYTDDPETAEATRQLYAYRVQVNMDGTSDQSGSPNQILYEGNSPEEFTLSLAHTQKKYYHSDSPVDISHHGSCTWTLKTQPDAAGNEGTSGGSLTCEVFGDAGGSTSKLHADAEDGDLNDGTTNLGSFSISTGVSIGIEASVGYSTPSITFGSDTDEAAGWMGFGFASHRLGTQDSNRFSIKSSPAENPGPYTFYHTSNSYEYAPGWSEFSGAHDDKELAQARTMAYFEIIDGNSNNSTWAQVEVTGSVLYCVRNATYDSSEVEYLPAESGYN